MTPTGGVSVAPSCSPGGGTGRASSSSKGRARAAARAVCPGLSPVPSSGDAPARWLTRWLASGIPRGRLHCLRRMSNTSAPPPGMFRTSPAFRRGVLAAIVVALIGFGYVLRGVLVPLFFAFLLAYALDPFVDWLEARRVPRTLAAPVVVLAIAGLPAPGVVFAIPLFIDELRAAAADLPDQLKGFEERMEPWLWQNFHFRPP